MSCCSKPLHKAMTGHSGAAKEHKAARQTACLFTCCGGSKGLHPVRPTKCHLPPSIAPVRGARYCLHYDSQYLKLYTTSMVYQLRGSDRGPVLMHFSNSLEARKKMTGLVTRRVAHWPVLEIVSFRIK